MRVINTLSSRLALASAIWTAAALVVAGVLLTSVFRDHIERRFDAMLVDHLEETVAASEIDASGRLTLTWRPADPRFARPLSGWYWLIARGEDVLAESRSLHRQPLSYPPPPVGEGPQVAELAGPDGARLRAVVQDITLPGSRDHFAFVAAGPVSDVEQDVAAFRSGVILTLTVLGLGLLGVILVQIRYGLRPLRELREALAAVRSGSTTRLPERFPAEIQPVVSELNALLDHNVALLERARTQTGNLAHALKNPLTVIVNEANALPGEHGRVLRDQAGAMREQIERHLSRARAAGAPALLGARAEVAAVARELAFSLGRLHADKPIEFRLDELEGLYFAGDTADLEEMLGNLMDNACKWARSAIEVHGVEQDGRLSLTIDDDGAGIEQDRRRDVLERGLRLDEAAPGAGLGLDIVRDIAELYRGSLELGASPLGGLRARLALPAARRESVPGKATSAVLSS
ncbi:MAG: sensor histidine kinase [Gammaproteobacteria bacterium]|nr:sensor histidine kinase [Gammaproteobacteria bacterium]